MFSLASTRHSINTTDEFYEKENDFFDENSPIYSGLVTEFYKALTTSNFKPHIIEKYGEQLVKLANVSIKTYDDCILEDLKLENKLSSQYTKLIATAQIEFKGEIYNLSQLTKFCQDENRETRKQAEIARSSFFASHQDEFDDIYDKLVKVRTSMAKKLGYENFVQMGYDRMLRTDYDAKMVKEYR